MMTPRKKEVLIIFIAVLSFFVLPLLQALGQGRLENIYPDLPNLGSIKIIKPVTIYTPLPEFFRYVFAATVTFGGLVIMVSLIWAGVKFYLAAAKGEALAFSEAKNRIFQALIGAFLVFGSIVILNTIEPQIIVNQVGIKSTKGIVLWNVPNCNDMENNVRRKYIINDSPDLGISPTGDPYIANSFMLYTTTPIEKIIFYSDTQYQGDAYVFKPDENTDITDCQEISLPQGARSVRVVWRLPGLYLCTAPYRRKQITIVEPIETAVVDPFAHGTYIPDFNTWECLGEEYYLGQSTALLPEKLAKNVGGIRFVPNKVLLDPKDWQITRESDIRALLTAQCQRGGPCLSFSEWCAKKKGKLRREASGDRVCATPTYKYQVYGAILFENPNYLGHCSVVPGFDIAYLPGIRQLVSGHNRFPKNFYTPNTSIEKEVNSIAWHQMEILGLSVSDGSKLQKQLKFVWASLRDMAKELKIVRGGGKGPPVRRGQNISGLFTGEVYDEARKKSIPYKTAPFQSVMLFTLDRLQIVPIPPKNTAHDILDSKTKKLYEERVSKSNEKGVWLCAKQGMYLGHPEFENYCIGPLNENTPQENMEVAPIYGMTTQFNLENVEIEALGTSLAKKVESIIISPPQKYIAVLFEGNFTGQCQAFTRSVPDLYTQPIGRCRKGMSLELESCVNSALIIKTGD